MATITNGQTVQTKVLREFFFKPDDAPRSQKPKKYKEGETLSMTGIEYKIHSSTNRVCLPAEFDELVKQYAKPKAEQRKG